MMDEENAIPVQEGQRRFEALGGFYGVASPLTGLIVTSAKLMEDHTCRSAL